MTIWLNNFLFNYFAKNTTNIRHISSFYDLIVSPEFSSKNNAKQQLKKLYANFIFGIEKI